MPEVGSSATEPMTVIQSWISGVLNSTVITSSHNMGGGCMVPCYGPVHPDKQSQSGLLTRQSRLECLQHFLLRSIGNQLAVGKDKQTINKVKHTVAVG